MLLRIHDLKNSIPVQYVCVAVSVCWNVCCHVCVLQWCNVYCSVCVAVRVCCSVTMVGLGTWYYIKALYFCHGWVTRFTGLKKQRTEIRLLCKPIIIVVPSFFFVPGMVVAATMCFRDHCLNGGLQPELSIMLSVPSRCVVYYKKFLLSLRFNLLGHRCHPKATGTCLS